MDKKSATFTVSPWRGEFYNRETEAAFRQHTAAEMARDLQIALRVWVILLLFFGVLDYVVYGINDVSNLLAASRLLVVFAILVLMRRVRQSVYIAASGVAVTALEVIGLTAYALVFVLRPELAVYNVGIMMAFIIAIYVFIPNRVMPATIAATYAAVGTIFLLAMLGVGSEALFGLFVMLIIPSSLGHFAALRLNRMQRQHFVLLTQARSFNDDLRREIEQRRLLEQELKQQAITDPLTGLCNRRHFEILFQRELERSKRSGSPLSFCLVDLDYFKQINDSWGHEAGDRVLQLVATCFQDSLRQTDVVARIGGEEFVLLMPDTDLQAAAQLIERLRDGLQQQRIEVNEEVVQVTATFGVSRVEEGESSLMPVMRRADKALYRGKAQGRNCVVLAEDVNSTYGEDRAETRSA